MSDSEPLFSLFQEGFADLKQAIQDLRQDIVHGVDDKLHAVVNDDQDDLHVQIESLTLREIVGDLFAAPSNHSLAHCVSEDLHMSQGIAKQFKNQFGNIEELLLQSPKVGSVVYLKSGERYIYYLVTKKVS